jgi:hypothetical protein
LAVETYARLGSLTVGDICSDTFGRMMGWDSRSRGRENHDLLATAGRKRTSVASKQFRPKRF